MPVVCKRLLVATVCVFMAQVLFTRPANVDDISRSMELIGHDIEDVADELPEGYSEEMLRWQPRISIVQEWLELDPAKVMRGQIWRLVSYAFCHQRLGVWHLLFNMVFLYWFGTRLEQMYGSTEFCLFYFASAICAGVTFLALDLYTGSSASLIGASGAVWGLVALYLIHHPYERINIYGMFPVEIRWLALIYLILDLHPVLLALNSPGMMYGGVTHASHLGGAAFGFLYFHRNWRLQRTLNRITGKSTSDRWQSQTVTRPPRDVIPVSSETRQSTGRIDPKRKRLEADLDQVLDKIQAEGRESLNEHELQILEEASEQFRRK